ncbi:Arm DNA-binding domain-containing protein, partial [Prevotella melaninogenica]|uniref:Arm DNA-binding domain-containing protein n=1 Tax=Prevotella melaninogenica TaxID=28132 RepID=UPI0001C40D0D
MKTTFKVSYYLRSNYENKEGKSPVMLRIYLGGEKANLGSTKIFVDKSKWSNKTSRMIGRTAEALFINASIDALTTTLMQIYWKYETSEELSIDLIRSVFLGTDKEYTTFLPVFDKYIDSITQQVGKTLTKCTFYKYKVVRQNFQDFLQAKYHRKDIGLTELTSAVVQDFELYLTSVVGGVH